MLWFFLPIICTSQLLYCELTYCTPSLTAAALHTQPYCSSPAHPALLQQPCTPSPTAAALHTQPYSGRPNCRITHFYFWAGRLKTAFAASNPPWGEDGGHSWGHTLRHSRTHAAALKNTCCGTREHMLRHTRRVQAEILSSSTSEWLHYW